MKITGKLTKVLKKQTGVAKTGKEWQKQSFILDTGADFNNEICIDCFGDKIELIQNLREGAEIEVKINLSSKEFKGRYYHNVSAWEINLQDGFADQDVESDEMPF
jgi:hypothetical protein